tara:strand:- start:1936 stop:3339 length:1404 start_codon:yes stop_codon:yes gene_type:complete
MQIPVINGIYTNEDGDFRTSYPRNLVPVSKKQGISNGYLRPGDGIVSNGSGSGIDRGGINWDGVCYRVMGTELVSISSGGDVTVLGYVGGSSLVSFDYSFDYLAIASNGNLFYWDNSTLQQVTDTDLGLVLDVQFVDGYFMTTDGTSLIVTDLSDPVSVNPLKYGSSEIDPDPIKSIQKVRNEIHAINRYTIEVFDNVGGTGFPFQRIDGAQITRGSVGTHANCVFDTKLVAFLGGGRNEPVSVFIGGSGDTAKVSTREIDQILQGYSESQLSQVKLEQRIDKSHKLLYVHLPDQTLVYDAKGSQDIGELIWFILTSGINDIGQYRAKNLVWCYDQWLVGDPTTSNIGYLTESISSHWGDVITWQFGTAIVYNEGNSVIFHELELVALTGRVALGKDPIISTQYSLDGEVWSQERSIKSGKQGDRSKRLVWLSQGHMRNFRMQRFNGTSDSHLTFARLEARLEAMAF